MDPNTKKHRDTSRLVADRGTIQALKVVAPAIASCNSRLARCRAIVTLSKPGYAEQVRVECQALRAEISGVRKQLERIVLALPIGQAGTSRIRDTRLALDKLDFGVDGILEILAAGAALPNGVKGQAVPVALLG
jgi:hypothetical protein